mgnify:CR=1 FL=1
MNRTIIAIIVLLIVAGLLWFVPKQIPLGSGTDKGSSSGGGACQMKRQEGIQGLTV